jgi:hypothetical protein
MKANQRCNSIIEGFELVKEFARTIERGHFEDRFAATAFVDVARHMLVFVEQIDGRRSLSRADLACAVAMLARATDQTWRDDLKHVATAARKLEKQLGKLVQKQDPFFFEASFEQ